MIIKRDNTKYPVQIKEIRAALEWSSQGLSINYLELESHTTSIYTETLATSQIQLSLIDIALRLTSPQHPDWRFMATRLALWELYQKAKHSAILRSSAMIILATILQTPLHVVFTAG